MLKWTDIVQSDKELAPETIRKRDGQLKIIYNALQEQDKNWNDIDQAFIENFIEKYSDGTKQNYLKAFSTINIYMEGSPKLQAWLQKKINGYSHAYAMKKNEPAEYLEFYDPELASENCVKILAMFLNNPETNALRLSDVRNIKMEDDSVHNYIDDEYVLHIRDTSTKNKDSRDIQLSEDFVDSLFEFAGTVWLMQKDNGDKYSESSSYLSNAFKKVYGVNHGDARKHNCNQNLSEATTIQQAMTNAKTAGHSFKTEIENYIDDDDTISLASEPVSKTRMVEFPPVPKCSFVTSDGRKGYFYEDGTYLFL